MYYYHSFQEGIKFGFFRGSELHDPEKLLTGSGKVHHCVEVKLKKDIQDRAMKQLMKEAIKAWKARKQTQGPK